MRVRLRLYNIDMPYKKKDDANKFKAKWVKDRPGKRKLTNKVAWIKAKYGEEAKEYFLNNAKCSRCGEDRIAALAIHHTLGKSVNMFEVLCSNCHLVHHGGEYTLDDAINRPTLKKPCLHCMDK